MLNEMLSFAENIDNQEEKKKTITSHNKQVNSLLIEVMPPLKHTGFLMDMTLSHLISYQEAMFKDFIYSVLVNKKETLKSKKSKLSYEVIIDFDSMQSLVAYLAKNEVDQLGHGSVDDISTYLDDKFGIDMKKLDFWNEVVEATYRRNIVVHNKGFTNDKYCNRMCYPKENKKLSMDTDYLISTTENLIKLCDYISDSIVDKFNLK
ncbi:hypothetical protein [Enterovibrio norvegicus]|uniref:hypothetical protein n=1 Tax=Enterovibrio norvegicus TaxID=188144 RepID=UPI00352E2AD1